MVKCRFLQNFQEFGWDTDDMEHMDEELPDNHLTTWETNEQKTSHGDTVSAAVGAPAPPSDTAKQGAGAIGKEHQIM